MTRHRMFLAAFLMQSDCPSRTARPQILDLQLQRRGDARKAVGQGGDQGAVAQIAQGRGRDRGEQFASFIAIEHRGLAGLDDVLGPAHRRRRVHRDDLPGDEPVKTHTHGRKLLLHTRSSVCLLQVFHPGRDVERPDCREQQPAIFAPGEEPAAGARIGPACMIVVDVGGEEFDVAPVGGFAEIGDRAGTITTVKRRISPPLPPLSSSNTRRSSRAASFYSSIARISRSSGT